MATDTSAPSAKEVEKAHRNADTDGKPTAAHHTLGPGTFQSSPGNHTHDGAQSALVLGNVTLTGVKTGGTALNSVIAALVALGATDTTT
jgi:hypothetical protein